MSTEKIKLVHPNILLCARELRHSVTTQESKLWEYLRNKRFHGLKFRRQHPIHRFILDFFCYEHQLAIEIDGSHHFEMEQQNYDFARTQWLKERNIKLLRFTNIEINKHIDDVLRKIASECGLES
ncbi:endonuclease domain-containing protein [Thioflexithrix psekupsensis]|uniref:DUF559 domain-containing protein n=1 Tax=Thioflexithrix psekupsensis TaxID=1570016 RepID=A0A251X4J3_9GAMM|nr:endonuclease domain-containing protein [Thioflexithrix psekupsensis]OUD12310.1 hypothetical protein TPSD3_14435 [Thioflexithrix psekupsensis]